MSDEMNEVMKFMQEMSKDIKDIKTRVIKVEEKVVKMETVQENVTNKHIQLLAEGYMPMAKKLDNLDMLSEDMKIVKSDIDIIKRAV